MLAKSTMLLLRYVGETVKNFSVKIEFFYVNLFHTMSTIKTIEIIFLTDFKTIPSKIEKTLLKANLFFTR